MDRILLIEDDDAVAASLIEGLQAEGFTVQWVTTGREGVAAAQEKVHSLVILDVRLPDGSGFDFCKEMRLFRLTQPILMLTVQSDEADKVHGLEMGADDYMTKPYKLRELIARVRALIRRAYGDLATGDTDLLHAGDLVIDRVSGTVSRGDRQIMLTPIEFRLLVFFALNPNKVFSRKELIAQVWGYEPDFYEEKSVNAHVSRLRDKVEPYPNEPSLILTVPGKGYRLVSVT